MDEVLSEPFFYGQDSCGEALGGETCFVAIHKSLDVLDGDEER